LYGISNSDVQNLLLERAGLDGSEIKLLVHKSGIENEKQHEWRNKRFNKFQAYRATLSQLTIELLNTFRVIPIPPLQYIITSYLPSIFDRHWMSL
jgi:hypothetical protein